MATSDEQQPAVDWAALREKSRASVRCAGERALAEIGASWPWIAGQARHWLKDAGFYLVADDEQWRDVSTDEERDELLSRAGYVVALIADWPVAIRAERRSIPRQLAAALLYHGREPKNLVAIVARKAGLAVRGRNPGSARLKPCQLAAALASERARERGQTVEGGLAQHGHDYDSPGLRTLKDWRDKARQEGHLPNPEPSE